MDTSWASIIYEGCSRVGIPVMILGYFLYRDWKFTAQRIDIDKQIAVSLALIRLALGLKEDK